AAGLKTEGTDRVLEIAGTPARIPSATAAALAGFDGGTITVGIRPEDVRLEAAGPGVTLRGTVEVREPLGNEVLVHWRTAAGEILSRIPGQVAPDVDESADLHLAWDKLHFFDPVTERALGTEFATA